MDHHGEGHTHDPSDWCDVTDKIKIELSTVSRWSRYRQ
jgi:hypothetical protein